MSEYMTTDAARSIERDPIEPGQSYTFYSTLHGVNANDVSLREYTGQKVTVIKDAVDYDAVDIGESLWDVRAEDGVVFQAFDGELNGWYHDTGQFYFPDGRFALDQN